MVFFNYALRKLNAKIVYYGPGLCGKTTNLQWIHDHFEGGQRGKMLSLATEGDRTIFFDLLPLENYWALRYCHGPYQGRHTFLITSRGCSLKCTFCASNALWTRRWRTRQPKRVVDEMPQSTLAATARTKVSALSLELGPDEAAPDDTATEEAAATVPAP